LTTIEIKNNHNTNHPSDPLKEVPDNQLTTIEIKRQ